MAKNKSQLEFEKYQKAFQMGLSVVQDHNVLSSLSKAVSYEFNLLSGYASINQYGKLRVNVWSKLQPFEWAYVVAHCMLHLGLGHCNNRLCGTSYWEAAADVAVARLLEDFKIGTAPFVLPTLPKQDEDSLYSKFFAEGVPEYLRVLGVGNMEQAADGKATAPKWEHIFASSLIRAVDEAVEYAAGKESKTNQKDYDREWFVSSYPFLGALAASFNIVSDPKVCQNLDISVAAVNAQLQTIYINPAAGLSPEERRFVMAHEILHVGLQHHTRADGRDPFLWNVACDYVINGWLHDMQLGTTPDNVLFDSSLKGLSAESIYDTIVTDLRTARKLATFKGVGMSDILAPSVSKWWQQGAGIELDELYKRALANGLEYHQQHGRGFIPADLIEEIAALSQPAIPWDVALAKWFEIQFPPIERKKSYSRLSRRQSATPDIARPYWSANTELLNSYTFGVVLDTSGSMSSKMLAQALGCIASYAAVHDVAAVRVICCDAEAHDMGYMPTEQIAHKVQVRGRGGTVLQPALELLQHSPDFPVSAPILIITDGYCDVLSTPKEHAYLIPKGRKLPFAAKGPIFYMSEPTG